MTPELTTDRLRLEALQLQDAPFIMELLNSPKWLQYIGERNVKTLEDARAYIQRSYINYYKKYGYGVYKMVLKSTGTAIGTCGLVKRPYFKHHDIGYAILSKYERKGYTFEAASAIMDFAQNQLQLHPILAFTLEDNLASQSLLKKLGLHFDKYIKIPKNEETMLLFST